MMPSRHAIVVASVLLLGTPLASATAASAQNRGDCQGRSAEDWSITIAAPNEPGQRLVVEGRVVLDNGETPVPGATVFVFHTDAEGYYSPGGMDESNARLCGMMLTDEQGRYRFETIRPAHYATGGGPPAHVHYRVWGDGVPRQSFTLQFEGDSYLGERGGDASGNEDWATLRPLEEGADGTLRVTRDLKVR